MSAVHSPPAGDGARAERWAERWIAEILASLPEAPPHERPATTARLAAMLIACARDEEALAALMRALREVVRGKDPRGVARIEIALGLTALARDDDATAKAHLAAARKALKNLPPSIAARAWILEARLARMSGDAIPKPPPDPEGSPDDVLDPDERLELAAEFALERAQVARETGSLATAHTELSKAHELVELSGSQLLVASFEVEAACYAADAA